MATESGVATAEYVRAQLKELARLSKGSGLDILAYLIDVAVMEAESILMAKKDHR